MSKEKQELMNSIIADYAESYGSFGLNPLMGRIVALLIISREPRSLDDIAETLEMSKGPISQICRRLKDKNLIEKVWVPGDRKDYYKAAEDIFGQAFQNQMEKMRRNISIAGKYAEKAGENGGEDAGYIISKMKEMRDFYTMMDDYNHKFLADWKKSRDA